MESDAHVELDANVSDAHVESDAHVALDANVESDAHVEADADVGEDGGALCSPAGIGAACDSEGGCQTGLRCYGAGDVDFCSVDRSPDCGGFAMTRCPASAPYCLRPIGSSLGACATAEEAVCICAIARDRIQDGEGTETCPPEPRP